MGCCMGQALIDADGFGLCQSWRAAAVTALTGFQSATACSQTGQRRRLEQLNVLVRWAGCVPHQLGKVTVIVPAGVYWQ